MIPCRLLALALVSLPACGSAGTGSQDGGGDAGATDCITPTGAGTMHGATLAQAETWTAAASPHLLPYDTSITAVITLEPCALVLIGAQRTITVAAGGSIVATGTALEPVAIAPKDSAPWASIRTLGGGKLSLTYTGVVGGGDPLNSVPDFAGALDIRADQNLPPAEILHADHLVIQDSASQGIYLHESGGFSAASSDVLIERSKGYPIHASANLAGTIPSGLYTGNGTDEILLSGSDTAQTIRSWDVTFADHGVPYHIGNSSAAGRLDVGGAPSMMATLTIEPGVMLRFKKGGALYVDYSHGSTPATGALVAVGTSAKPIRFTSAEPTPAAGDWLGLNFGDLPDSADQLAFVTVEYAGGASGSGSASCPYPAIPINDAAIRIYGAPTTAFITHTTISDSASNGIDRGWASDNQPDFLVDGTNTFLRVARCTQTFPKDASNGGCTNPVLCPM
jgi:hypothetical protein